MIQRQGNGSYRASFGLQVPGNFFRDGASSNLQDVEATRQRLLSEFYVDWVEEYKDLIRHVTNLRVWPLYTLSIEDMGWKSVLGVTLAGDAAHLSFTGGEGVNLAMTDSLKLSNKITEHGVDNLDQAVKGYEADMFLRGVARIAKSKVMENVMHGEDPQGFLQMVGS